MNAQTENVTKLTKEGFMSEKYKEESYSFFPRFLSAFWGSATFHLSFLIVSSGAYAKIVATIIDNYILLFLYLLYSTSFALIAAFSSKGSLVRHFFSGVALPGFTYWMCSIIVWILSNVNIQQFSPTP